MSGFPPFNALPIGVKQKDLNKKGSPSSGKCLESTIHKDPTQANKRKRAHQLAQAYLRSIRPYLIEVERLKVHLGEHWEMLEGGTNLTKTMVQFILTGCVHIQKTTDVESPLPEIATSGLKWSTNEQRTQLTIERTVVNIDGDQDLSSTYEGGVLRMRVHVQEGAPSSVGDITWTLHQETDGACRSDPDTPPIELNRVIVDRTCGEDPMQNEFVNASLKSLQLTRQQSLVPSVDESVVSGSDEAQRSASRSRQSSLDDRVEEEGSGDNMSQ